MTRPQLFPIALSALIVADWLNGKYQNGGARGRKKVKKKKGWWRFVKKNNGGVQYPLAPHPQDINLFNPIKQIERDWDCLQFELFLRMWWDATPLYQEPLKI